MNSSQTRRNLLPPRLSMDEYVDFVEAAICMVDPVMAMQQKQIEERIRVPFRMSGDAAEGRGGSEPQPPPGNHNPRPSVTR